MSIRGSVEIDGKKVLRLTARNVRLAIVPAVPFEHVGAYHVTNDQPGGTTLAKRFRLERGGFEGPLTVSLADRQLRYLGGVTAPAISVPPGPTEFDYPIIYPVEIEQGHTSRAPLIVVGEMTDFDGSRHRSATPPPSKATRSSPSPPRRG